MWGAKPPTFLKALPGPRGRPDLKNAPNKNPARLPSGTQLMRLQAPGAPSFAVRGVPRVVLRHEVELRLAATGPAYVCKGATDRLW